ncbi:hypothetical protein QR680_009404 [Steinernema hermaphroditum]|uniref:C3HC-type domain-containing protein n=1 Tax=Steinernema hermaphroditum TaxID=289476 RepID=A0AA39ILH5_9BILA|nr:hypothetical protein QR680_009404 [Steinernema hermaphroditum]
MSGVEEVSTSGQPLTPDSETLPPLKRRAPEAVDAGESSSKLQRRTAEEVESVDLFHQRLSTFTAGRWFGKPLDLSPRECARRGWRCSERDVVRCDGCGAVVNASLPLLTTTCSLQAYNACVDQCAAMLKTSHKTECVWREAVFREPPEEADAEKIKQAILQRCAGLEPIMRREFRVVKHHEITREHLRKFEGRQPEALLLAICGWSYGGIRDQVRCHRCLRSTYLFLFHEAKPFDPLAQHFHWCAVFDTGKYLPRWREEVNAAADVKFQPDFGCVVAPTNIKIRPREALRSHARRGK